MGIGKTGKLKIVNYDYVLFAAFSGTDGKFQSGLSDPLGFPGPFRELVFGVV
jgi:hypothetical protein